MIESTISGWPCVTWREQLRRDLRSTGLCLEGRLVPSHRQGWLVGGEFAIGLGCPAAYALKKKKSEIVFDHVNPTLCDNLH